MRKIARRVLLALLFGVTFLVLVGCSPKGDASAAPSPLAEPAESVPADNPTEGQETAAGSVQVVYFHVAKPCDCMAAVGQAIAYSIDTYFQTELASGLLSFVDVVSDDTANASAVGSFGSQPFDLFFVTTIGDESSVEPDYDVWNLMGDDEAIAQHVKSLVEARLAGLAS